MKPIPVTPPFSEVEFVPIFRKWPTVRILFVNSFMKCTDDLTVSKLDTSRIWR